MAVHNRKIRRNGSIELAVKRKLFQITAALVTNANFAGFAKGSIYSGKLKHICVPGLNCYSCPGALGACPLGSLQTMLADSGYKMSFYVIGLLAAFGVVFGRAVCGWLCPFGFLQELLHKPVEFFSKRNQALNRALGKARIPYFFRYAKYLLLLLAVILFPLFLTDKFGFGAPYFCELICPAGTITAALPLFLADPRLRALIGALFYLKVTVAAVIVSASAFSNRFFCKYLCPLGAIYGFFNRFSFIRLEFSEDKCNQCGICSAVCGMGINPREAGRRPECINCGQCAKACPRNALRMETPLSALHILANNIIAKM